MDHRISKDMISSGMIPSGEKNQEDLSRTQYGTAPSPNALADVYKKMYEHHKKDADGNTIPHEGEELNEFVVTGTLAALKTATALAGKKALAGGAKMLAGKAGLKAVAKPTISNVAKAGGEALKRTSNLSMDPRLNMARQTVSSIGQPKGKTNKTMAISAGADLFDIVKGQLLDEGLSEEEIRDIMLTLTPDEILSEIKDYQMDSLKRQTAPGGGKDYSIEDKKNVQNLTRKPVNRVGARTKSGIVGSYVEKPKPTTEEYKNFDPNNPDPKQVAVQAKQEKNRQKSNDPMGVKNRNIGGQGLDPMDK